LGSGILSREYVCPHFRYHACLNVDVGTLYYRPIEAGSLLSVNLDHKVFEFLEKLKYLVVKID